MMIRKFSCFLMLMLSALLLAGRACCQSAAGGKAEYKPFSVDKESITATLKIKGSPLVEKYAAVFQKHHLDPASPIDWNGLIEQIVGMNLTDQYISGELTFDTNDDAVEISAASKEGLQKMLNVVRPILASPQKTDAFLIQQEALLKKKK